MGTKDGLPPPKPHLTTVKQHTVRDITTILLERHNEYGGFEDVACISQSLKSTFRVYGKIRWHHMQDDQKEALEMIASKIARILNGNTNNEDSWRDIAGYATLVADRLKGVKR